MDTHSLCTQTHTLTHMKIKYPSKRLETFTCRVILFFSYLCVRAGYVQVSMNACKGQKRHSEPRYRVAGSNKMPNCLTWMLGTELWFSASIARAPHY